MSADPEYDQLQLQRDKWIDAAVRQQKRAVQAESSLSQALARIEELEKALEWQPIETAPKDGTRFLAAEPEDGWLVGICLWCKTPHVPLYGFHFTDGDVENWEIAQPTHWRPLPATPRAGGDGQ